MGWRKGDQVVTVTGKDGTVVATETSTDRIAVSDNDDPRDVGVYRSRELQPATPPAPEPAKKGFFGRKK